MNVNYQYHYKLIELFKKTETFKTISRKTKVKLNVSTVNTKRMENEQNLSFEQHFLGLVEKNNLKEIYEAIFK